MSDPAEKFKNSKRRHLDETAIQRQLKIAKQHGFHNSDEVVKEPHRLAKHHAMDCGRPGCMLCGNPRKLHKDKLTIQEKRFDQNVDSSNDKRSNGLSAVEVEENTTKL